MAVECYSGFLSPESPFGKCPVAFRDGRISLSLLRCWASSSNLALLSTWLFRTGRVGAVGREHIGVTANHTSSLFFFSRPHYVACRTSLTTINPMSPAVKVWNLNQWTTREGPSLARSLLKLSFLLFCIYPFLLPAPFMEWCDGRKEWLDPSSRREWVECFCDKMSILHVVSVVIWAGAGFCWEGSGSAENSWWIKI